MIYAILKRTVCRPESVPIPAVIRRPSAPTPSSLVPASRPNDRFTGRRCRVRQGRAVVGAARLVRWRCVCNSDQRRRLHYDARPVRRLMANVLRQTGAPMAGKEAGPGRTNLEKSHRAPAERPVRRAVPVTQVWRHRSGHRRFECQGFRGDPGAVVFLRGANPRPPMLAAGSAGLQAERQYAAERGTIGLSLARPPLSNRAGVCLPGGPAQQASPAVDATAHNE